MSLIKHKGQKCKCPLWFHKGGTCLVRLRFLPLFSKQLCIFCLKLRITLLVGKRQTKNIFPTMKLLSVWDVFAYPGCAKSSKLERLMIVQTHTNNVWNGKLFLFSPQKLHSSSVCLKDHNSFQFGAFGTQGIQKDLKYSKILFLEKYF